MLATSWPSSIIADAPSTAHAYLPSRPSPLSPRSANACPRPQFWGPRAAMGSSTRSNTPDIGSGSSENDAPLPYAKRDIKSNPVLKRAKQTPDEARDRRRDMFMKKVERGREDRQWKGRSEQILRSDYMAERRRWEEERNREARLFFFSSDYEDDEQPVTNENDVQNVAQGPATPRLVAQPDDGQQVDEMVQMEEEELRALLTIQEQQDVAMTVHEHDVPSSPTRYGSDEEDYDEIFMELVSSQQPHVQDSTDGGLQAQQGDAEMMDMV